MLSLVCYRDQSANEEKAFFESLQMNFDKIKSCGQIFSAIVLLGDFNAHLKCRLIMVILHRQTPILASGFSFLWLLLVVVVGTMLAVCKSECK